jgi:hypothetical protein
VGVVLEARWFRQENEKNEKNLIKVRKRKRTRKGERKKVVDFHTIFFFF